LEVVAFGGGVGGPTLTLPLKQIEVLPLGTNWRSVQAAFRNCGFRRFNGDQNLKLLLPEIRSQDILKLSKHIKYLII